MSASRNASTGRNVGWRQAHLWISPPFFGWLVGLYKSRLLRGCPNRLFGIIAVDKDVNRFVPRCSGGGRRFEGWHRVHLALLRLYCLFVIAFASI